MYHKEKLLELGIEDYKKGKITISELAKKSSKTIWEIIDVLKQRKVQ